MTQPKFSAQQIEISPSLLSYLEKANAIASNSSLEELLNQMLDLILEISEAETGTLYLVDHKAQELVFAVVKGSPGSKKLIGQRISALEGIAGASVQSKQPILIEDITKDPRWLGDSTGREQQLTNCLAVPLLLENQAIGVVQIFNFTHYAIELIQLLGNRMASEVDKALLLQASRERSEHLQALVEIIGYINSTLNQDDILRIIVEHAHRLLNAEASSLFLIDPETKHLNLHVSTHIPSAISGMMSVPWGEGIIGHVVKTGKPLIVPNTQEDVRHYKLIDQITQFHTHSLLVVPLTTKAIALGRERGETTPKIIGGLEAVNKQNGLFSTEDSDLLETLGRQAATVLQIASSFEETTTLFFDVIRSLTAAIDARDPYTKGHSQRVSEYSVAIAKRMQLDPETIHHIRIGAILHDVGKIGISDAVLKKPDLLTPDEREEMKRHPLIGEAIMGDVQFFHAELPALAEHHERLDGSGYPYGLKGDQISLMGRIVAVADVFDAMTSDRPYRRGIPAEEVIDHLMGGRHAQFDAACVEALVASYLNGEIVLSHQLIHE